MTVAELIAALAGLPQDAEITCQAGTCSIEGAEVWTNRDGRQTVNLD